MRFLIWTPRTPSPSARGSGRVSEVFDLCPSRVDLAVGLLWSLITRSILCYRTRGSLGGNGGVVTVDEVPSNRRGGSSSGWCYRRDGIFTGGETNLYDVTVKKRFSKFGVYIRKNES